ncbi:hypothetical protein [Chryseobacterium sp. CH21]|uniref:hypothetical protein n=1 Tax=Chryseobacterium sp. CH21 TaxID=713556 RepID=UPI001E3CD9CD|nr:hypothetical protein [Chryseobacterium sp. CH21]
MNRRNWIKLSAFAGVGLAIPKAVSASQPNQPKIKSGSICITCGVQYESANQEHCVICEDSRQFVNPKGQQWTTLEVVQKTHKNIIEKVAPNVYAIYTVPKMGIGQRAHLVISPKGNVLWDCITNLDESTIELVNKLGGIKAIAISHPHYYSTIVEWGKAFNAPVYIHEADKMWIQRKDPIIKIWSGREMELWEGMKIVLCGGHFDGAAVLFVPKQGGQLFTGDNPQVCSDLKSVSFLYSYPNYIPLGKEEVLFIEESLKNLEYDSLYGAFGKYILKDGKQAVAFSVSRYLNHIR